MVWAPWPGKTKAIDMAVLIHKTVFRAGLATQRKAHKHFTSMKYAETHAMTAQVQINCA
jgi:hypothetical protein